MNTYYLIYFFLQILLPLLLIAFAWSLIITNLFGAPFVPTPKKNLEIILAAANLKKGQVFFDLGCGDGRVARIAANKYQVKAIGVDFNPFLITYARILNYFQKNKAIFLKRNFNNVDLKKANIIFLYLLPKNISQLTKKITSECQRGTLVISYCFEIEEWKENLVKKLSSGKKFTYYYSL